jgi:hypothetical protein
VRPDVTDLSSPMEVGIGRAATGYQPVVVVVDGTAIGFGGAVGLTGLL